MGDIGARFAAPCRANKLSTLPCGKFRSGVVSEQGHRSRSIDLHRRHHNRTAGRHYSLDRHVEIVNVEVGGPLRRPRLRHKIDAHDRSTVHREHPGRSHLGCMLLHEVPAEEFTIEFHRTRWITRYEFRPTWLPVIIFRNEQVRPPVPAEELVRAQGSSAWFHVDTDEQTLTVLHAILHVKMSI